MSAVLNKREYWISVEDMNNWLKYVKENGYKKAEYPIWYFWDTGKSLYNYYFIEDDLVNFALRFKFAGKLVNFYCRKDGENEQRIGTVSGTVAFRILSQYYKVPHIDPKYCADGDLCLTSTSLLWYNKVYDNTRNYCYGYDINSAFSYAMLKPMPDTSVSFHSGDIKEGEIGFVEVVKSQGVYIEPRFSGFAYWIYPIMESPFKRFVDVWYGQKQKSEGALRNKAKSVLNYSIGFLQRVNPFLRATIIYYCNENVKSFIDENTVYCNTDSIVSLKPRDDIILGNEIGQWKLEKEGPFAYRGCIYQWGTDKPAYRGIPKSWFPEGYDLLTDNTPPNHNLYIYSPIKEQLIGVEHIWHREKELFIQKADE